jgi:uncharacterized protein
MGDGSDPASSPERGEPRPGAQDPPTPSQPGSAAAPPTLEPTAGREREPILDLLRGFALLGILLINVELMRGPGLYRLFLGEAAEPGTTLDRVVIFASGWLAGGKFVSSFALLFGVGAAFLVARAERLGHPPGALLARRYALLAVFGLAHMVLLFPGDILFVYAVAGFLLLPFVARPPRLAARWAAGILAALGGASALFGVVTLMTGSEPEAQGAAMGSGLFGDRRDAALAAYTDGTWSDVFAAQAFEALVVQAGQLMFVPWVLAMFLVGWAIARAGVVTDLAGHRARLRRATVIGLGLGLPLNLPAGLAGPAGTDATTGSELQVAVAGSFETFVQFVGAPVLAIGYLAGIVLLALRIGTWWPLAAVGRMALTAYLLQSVVAQVVFVGFDRYGQVSPSEALIFVGATWALLLIVCPLWLSRFRFGPVEWLWRAWTYRQRPPLRH